ncbi:MAG: TIGR00730 family Rossman fold protein [Candidatus Nanopelagicaceae bacterium]|nr:TIGR00730 family Rossman fold protein [Candidatus Nanopelagicaceae bacterium]
MKIAVYCASSTAVSPENLQLGFDLGAAIAQQGHQLVWGGGAISVMGEVAKGARQFGGKTIGVIPERLMNVEFIDHDSSELHVVADMRERKGLIERLSDGFIALPGGIGTLEEFFEIWVGRYLGFHNKPIAVLDPSSVYQTLRIALDDLTAKNFMKPGQHELVKWCSEITEALNHLGDTAK